MKAVGKRSWQTVGHVLWKLVESSARHDLASLAAVIAFYVFFSLFPLVVLMLYASSVLLPTGHIEHLVTDMLSPYFPALPDASLLSSNIARLAQVGENAGLFSAITLTWSATSGFIALQQALDVIWEVRDQRSYFGRRLIAFAMLMVLLVLTVTSAVGMAVYPALLHTASSWRPLLPLLRVTSTISRVLFPVSLFLGFLVLYRFLPKRTTPWRMLLPGAFVAAVAMDFGRLLFVYAAGHFLRYRLIYGSLTTVMLLVLWIYIASIVMLFGAEFSAVLEASALAPPAATGS